MSYYVAEDGCRVAYEVVGSGHPMVLIPGLGGSGRFWSDVVPHLASKFEIVVVDHRGAWRSDRPSGSYSIETIAKDTVGILRSLGLGQAHIVGHSTGGLVAQAIALDHPEMVSSLVLSGTWASFDAQMTEMFRARAEVLERAGPAVYQRLTHALCFPAAYIEANADALERAVDEAALALEPIKVSLVRIAMLSRSSYVDRLGGLNVQTLVVAAQDDPLIPFAQSILLRDAIKTSRLERLDGSHFFPRVHPRRFAGLLLNFLEEVHAV
jgi:aminoacrylate hydrolase